MQLCSVALLLRVMSEKKITVGMIGQMSLDRK